MRAVLFAMVMFLGLSAFAQVTNIRGRNWILVSIKDENTGKVFEYDKTQALLYFSDTTFVISGRELHYGKCTFAEDSNAVKVTSHEKNEWTSRSKDSYFARYFWDLTYSLNVNMLEIRSDKGVLFRFLASK